jgi:hypothetical protein
VLHGRFVGEPQARIIWSSTWLGVGQTPPLLKLMTVRSLSKQRWIWPQ